jgi:hypothetical protein
MFLTTFLPLKKCPPSNETEANKKLFFKHLDAKHIQVSIAHKDVGVSKIKWLETYLPLTPPD